MTKPEENNDRLKAFLNLEPEHYKSIIRSERPSDMSFEDYKSHMKIYKLLVKGMLKGKWKPFNHKDSVVQST
jgi:hypothetical protein